MIFKKLQNYLKVFLVLRRSKSHMVRTVRLSWCACGHIFRRCCAVAWGPPLDPAATTPMILEKETSMELLASKEGVRGRGGHAAGQMTMSREGHTALKWSSVAEGSWGHLPCTAADWHVLARTCHISDPFKIFSSINQSINTSGGFHFSYQTLKEIKSQIV